MICEEKKTQVNYSPEILRFIINNCNINLDDIQNDMEQMERKELLEKHPYKIWEGKDGEWYTKLLEPNGTKKLRHRKTREELEDVIVEHIRNTIERPTVDSVFKEWLNTRLEREEIEKSTYSRYQRDFQRYFVALKEREINGITPFEIEEHVKNTIQELKLTRKAFNNMRTLIYGIFRYAKRKDLIRFNIKEIMEDIEFSKKEFKQVHHEDNEQVFMTNEEEKMIQYLEENQDLLNLGLLLLFKTGLRIGELVSLNKEDIHLNKISISKTETIYQDEDGETHYDIKSFPKTEAGIRDVIVPDNCLWLLSKIRKLCPFGQYMFMQDGERIRSYVFRTRLYSNCKKLGIVMKSPHKVRKTYGSKLYDAETITESFIIGQMGHTDITCLKKHYYYNRMTDKEKQEMLNQSMVL